MPYSFQSAISPNAAHLTAIGEVVMECAHLENIIQLLLMDMADLDFQRGRCITTHMPIRTICDSVRSLGGELGFNESEQKELTELMTTADRLVTSRNNIVHALWGITPQSTFGKGEATAVVIKARAKLTISQENMTPEAISEVARSIREHTLKIANFRSEFVKLKGQQDGIS